MQALSALNRHPGAQVLATFKDAIENDSDVQVKRARSALCNPCRTEKASAVDPTARGTRDNEVRKQAMSSLGQSRMAGDQLLRRGLKEVSGPLGTGQEPVLSTGAH